MRCKNCGWENPQGNLKCEKCNAPLTGSMADNPYRSGSSAIPAGQNLRGTLPEGQVFGSQAGYVPDAQSAHSCKKCGYPVAMGMNICPNCGESQEMNQECKNPGGEMPVSKCQKCGARMSASSKFCPSCGAPARAGTVNPWMSPQNGTFCTLKPLTWNNEGIEYNPLSYSGTAISLNRANTDPNNQSITSKEQAMLTYENGAWYIEDRSEQQTSFIHVGRKTKLESGDIIILGNRRFEFKG